MLYAVYEFLEHLGCRWYGPGELHTCIPQYRVLRLKPMDISARPALRQRRYGGEINRDVLLWCVRNRMNAAMHAEPQETHLYGFPRYHERPLPGRLMYTAGAPDREAGTSRNGDLERQPQEDSKPFCLSNPQSRRRWVDSAISFFKKHPEIDVALISPVHEGRLCECRRCRRSTKVALILRLMDELLSALRREGLGVEILYNAIHLEDIIEHPPKTPLQLDAENSKHLWMFVPMMGRCHYHRLDDPECREDSTPELSNVFLLSLLRAWHSAGYNGRIHISEYINRKCWLGLPVVCTSMLVQQFRLCNGYFPIAGLSINHPGHEFGVHILDCYLGARLALEGEAAARRFNELTREFFHTYYGDALAEPVARLYRQLEDTFGVINFFSFLPENIIRFCRTWTEAARNGTPPPQFDQLLPFRHLKYSAADGEAAAAMTLKEMRKRLEQARTTAEHIDSLRTYPPYRERWQKTYDHFCYGYRMFRFIVAQVDCLYALSCGETIEAQHLLKEAERLAETLPRHTTPWGYRDGMEMEATFRALEALRSLMERLK